MHNCTLHQNIHPCSGSQGTVQPAWPSYMTDCHFDQNYTIQLLVLRIGGCRVALSENEPLVYARQVCQNCQPKHFRYQNASGVCQTGVGYQKASGVCQKGSECFLILWSSLPQASPTQTSGVCQTGLSKLFTQTF